MLIRFIELFGILIPLAGIYALLCKHQQSGNTVRLMLTSFGALVMNSGCLFTALAKTDAEATVAVKVEWLGNAVFFYFFLTFIASYLHIRIPMRIRMAWAALEFVTVIIFWEDRLRRLIFGALQFAYHVRANIYSVQYEHSLLYRIRYLAFGLLLLCGIVFIAVRLLMMKLDSERRNLVRLAESQFIVAAALVILLVANPMIDPLPIFSSLALLPVVISMLTDGFFGVTDSGHEWVFKQMENAYIITDSLYGYLDANPQAIALFPELNRLHVNSTLPENLRSIFSVSTEQFMLESKTYSKKVTEIVHQGKVVGYGLLLEDVTEQQKYLSLLNDYNDRLQSEVAAKTQHIQKVQNSIITGMASVVESRDNSTGGHINRTSRVVRIFAKRLLTHADTMHLSQHFLYHVVKAAPMHDIGKISVDDTILRKPGKYTAEEYEIMKMHTAEGARMLKTILREVDDEEFVQIVLNVAHYHHERWDGTGYPAQLAGEEIPVEARIMALADVFDALVSKRCYKEAMPYDEAFAIMEESLGTQFDPALGRIFLECRDALCTLYNESEQSA
ncbi:MAG: HD domain-containing protein [Oscillospiraceae bacterium]|nr:HD domain-containing protein [Oscillospiraceae bacterium]